MKTIKDKAIDFLNKYTVYLPNDKKVHLEFGEELGKLIFDARRDGMDYVNSEWEKHLKKALKIELK